MSKKNKSIWIGLAGMAILAVISLFIYRQLRRPITVTGAIIVRDADFRKQLPIAGVEVRLASSLTKGPVISDPSGFFSLKLFKQVRKGQPITLQFRHANYQPLDLHETADTKLYIVRLVPVARTPAGSAARPPIVIANIHARYSIKTQSSVNIGSAVKTFEIQNVGNVPCGSNPICSPDGRWKASVGSIALDAGPGNQFHNARVSCIAGPCPFTKIDSDEFSSGGQKISATVRDWSDPSTYLLEAEVTHSMASQTDYQSFPVIFGTAFSFTLPAQAEGVSLEADVAGETIIFPLGPDILLSWANCTASVNKEQTRVYRCELKPGYLFQ